MIIITDKDMPRRDGKIVLSGILACECANCKKQGVYKLNEQEVNVLMEYQLKGRRMGALKDIFPNVPLWILSSAVEPLSNGFCICPECEAKRLKRK